MIPLTGAQFELEAGDYQAVVTELGAGLRALRHRGQQVIAGYEPDELPPGAAGQLLVPWPNRVDGGRYSLAGTDYQLDLTEPSAGNAIHGLTRWVPWSVMRHSFSEVLLSVVLLGRSGYPFCLEMEAEYQLSEVRGLQLSVTARNVGSQPAPYGTGSHPYLTTGLPTVDDCELTLAGALWLPVDERGIPSSPPQDVTGTEFDFRGGRVIGKTRIDYAFTGLDRDDEGRVWARLAHGGREVALWAGPGFHWLQVFTGDTLDAAHQRRALGMEPMTCPPNAFVTGTDVLTLEPGDTVTHTWGIQLTSGT